MKVITKYRDILAVVAFTIVAVALVFVLPPDLVAGRIVVSPLVLLLPGYALTSALFPGREFWMHERLIFSLALSLVLVILAGLLLNLTPWGLRADSWAVFLAGITLGACVVALVRRWRQGISNSRGVRAGGIGLNLRQGLLLGLAALIVGGAVAVSIIGAERQPSPGFTQLWILPANASNSKNAVHLGVSNMELTAMEYRLVVSVDGKVVKEWPTIDLNTHGQWEATLVIPQTGQTGTAKIEADLYRMDAPKTLYRQVVLWLGP